MNLFIRRRTSHLIARRIFSAVSSKVHSSGNNFRQLCELTANLEDLSRKKFEGLVRCPANYVPLTPISFLERAARVYGDRTSVVYGNYKCSWEETHLRCVKLASAMAQLGISGFDVVLPQFRKISGCFPNLCCCDVLHVSFLLVFCMEWEE